MAAERFVIIGSGLAAARAIEGIRDAGGTGPITMTGEESGLPYDRPPLAKDVLLAGVRRLRPTGHRHRCGVPRRSGRQRVLAFWLDRGRPLAGMHVNTWGSIDAVKDLIRRGETVDAALLPDPAAPLTDVVG